MVALSQKDRHFFGLGKVIVLGEHAVVYGEPALAASLDRGCSVSIRESVEGPILRLEKRSFRPRDDHEVARAFAIALGVTGLTEAKIELTVAFDIPVGAGLGSSAAFAVALVRGLSDWAGRELSEANLAAQSHEIECIFHGTPSGLDASLARGRAFGLYLKGQGLSPVKITPFRVIIADSGVTRSTQGQVEKVRERTARLPACASICKAIGELARQGAAAAEVGDLPLLGELMNMNHSLLGALSVSHPLLEALVHVARAEGAVGAKLTGAGGGGCIIALAPGRENEVEAALAKVATNVIVVELSAEAPATVARETDARETDARETDARETVAPPLLRTGAVDRSLAKHASTPAQAKP